ncbi:MAG: hypothetical protein WCG35_04500 [Betaproteobacteria bacterium]
MPKYPNLQRALLFKVLPESIQQQILSQPTLAEACLALEQQTPYAATEDYRRRRMAGEGIDAMAEIGLLGEYPGDVTKEQWAQLVELDPTSYYPTMMTARCKKRWCVRLRKGMGKEEYQDFINSIKQP